MISQLEFDKSGDGEKYKIERICDSKVYVKKSKNYRPSFYYLVLQKSYFKKENT